MEDAVAEAEKRAKATKYFVAEDISKFEKFFLPKFEIIRVRNLSGRVGT